MKTITKAVVIGLILLIAAVTLTAGCVQTGDENKPAAPSISTEPAGPEPTSEPITGGNTDETDYNTAILGDWKYTFPDSDDKCMVYHFDRDHTGTFTTYNKSITGIHWIYDQDKKSYMINYDKLGEQEYMVIAPHEGKYYLCSLGGGYLCEKVE